MGYGNVVWFIGVFGRCDVGWLGCRFVEGFVRWFVFGGVGGLVGAVDAFFEGLMKASMMRRASPYRMVIWPISLVNSRAETWAGFR